MKTPPTILNFLKSSGRTNDLPLNVLREFQEFEKHINKTMQSYDALPDFAAYSMKCFTKIEMFSMALMYEKYPAALSCHKEIMEMFGADAAFDDGITVASWIYFNFPVEKNGETIASLAFKDLSPNVVNEISPFLTVMLDSRFGLYEVLRNKQDTCHVKELITGREFILHQAFGTIDQGSIVLVRIFNLDGKNYIFGHSHEWPANEKMVILNMVKNKMSLFFPDKEVIVSYETMMRLAGPYWFSILGVDYTGDILNPDYYLKFYTKNPS